jgi:hypothetical protein
MSNAVEISAIVVFLGFRERIGSRVGGRRRVPRGNADWHRFPPAPLSTGRWVFPSPAGSERISATAFPTACAATGSSTSPRVAEPLAGRPVAFAATRGHDHEARSHTGTAPRRVIAASGTTPGRSCKRRPRSPRGPLLKRGCVVLAVIAHTASAASLEPSRRLPVFRLYAESLPSGRVLAELQTFPTLRHRSFPWCHCPYAGEPCGCSYPIPSPQTLAFALF